MTRPAAGMCTESGPQDSDQVKEPTCVASIRTVVGTLDTKKEFLGL